MIKIGKRKIGYNFKPLIICELGINHVGSLLVAKKMVNLAKKNGAEAIKNQNHILNEEMINEAKRVIPSNTNKSIYKVIEENLMTLEDEKKLKKYVEKRGMIYLSTPFSLSSAIKLNRLGIKAFKIGSGECNNIPLLEKICSFKKPIILSTGMNELKSIERSVKVLEKSKVKYALLHCKSEYPANINGLSLDFINVLKKKFPKSLVGYSDHTVGVTACISAMAKGACIIEKHFTDTKKRKGPDIICSMDPAELSFLNKAAEEIFRSNGTKKIISKIEKITAKFAFSSVVSINEIKKGEKFTIKNIWVKRPGTGHYPAHKFYKILGKKSKRDIGKDEFINRKDVKKK